jgi:esterase
MFSAMRHLPPSCEGLAWRIDLDRFEAVLPALADWTPCGVAGLPALILRGGASPYVTADDIEALRVHFPALSAATIDGAGHWVHADRPAAFVAAVEEFLGSLAVGAGGREVR